MHIVKNNNKFSHLRASTTQVMEKGNEQFEISANSWVICPMRCPSVTNPGGQLGE